jgi:hypothetical protein
MAHPIKATPTLNTKQTIEFVNRLCDEQTATEKVNLRASVQSVREKRNAATGKVKK